MIPAPSDAVCYAMCYIAWLVSMHVHVLVLCECFCIAFHTACIVFSMVCKFLLFSRKM